MNPAKVKGDKAELEIAKLLAELTGWPIRRKLGAGRLDDTGDLDGLPQTTGQVKNFRDIQRAVREALESCPKQQANAGATFGMSFIRRPGGRWFVAMTVEQAMTLLREATADP